MRWRTPIVILLAAAMAISCDQEVPTDTATEAPEATADMAARPGWGRNVDLIKWWMPDPFCGVFDGNGDIVEADCTVQLATPNDRAFIFVFKPGVANDTGETVYWDAYNPPQLMLDIFGLDEPPAPCVLLDYEGNLDLFTVNWRGWVTPEGEAILMCNYADRFEWDPPPGWVSPF